LRLQLERLAFAPAWTEYGQQHNVTFEVEREPVPARAVE
jgi:hypothetical protein